MRTINREFWPDFKTSQDNGSSPSWTPDEDHKVKKEYHVIHPLDDAPEAKRMITPEMGLIKLTPTVRASLFALRAYLVIMLGLVAYRVITMAH